MLDAIDVDVPDPLSCWDRTLADADLRIAATAICAHLDSRDCKHHDVKVRTTVTLDPDLAVRLKEYAHRKRTSFKTALNTLLRRGLAGKGPTPAARRRFAVEPHSGRFQPGVDPGRLNQLVDQLETEDFGRASQGDQ